MRIDLMSIDWNIEIIFRPYLFINFKLATDVPSLAGLDNLLNTLVEEKL
jgi:hypothetical protein